MPSALDTLIARIADEQLRADVRAAVSDLRKVTDFGLVFEAHIPETVRLPYHSIRRGIKVALRNVGDQSMFEVLGVNKSTASVRRLRHPDGSTLSGEDAAEAQVEEVPLGSLVALAEFGDPIYPGMRRLGSLDFGGDKPAHIVINGENYHVLEALQFTHANKIDCVYIDPPFNTGARDWKYNNRYVDSNDNFRHSKWLSFMNKRLQLTKNLLRQDEAVLLIAIDDNEVYSLGLLLDQVFHGYERQMVSITVSPRGKSRVGRLSQVDEYLIVVYIGSAAITDIASSGEEAEVRWRYLRRNDIESARGTVKGGPNQFYPIYVDTETGRIARIGDPLKPGESLDIAPDVPGTVAVFPVNDDGVHMNWGLTAASLGRALEEGFVRVTSASNPNQPYTFAYLTVPNIRKVKAGDYVVAGERSDGSKIVLLPGGKRTRPTTVWRDSSYDAGAYGTTLLRDLIPGRQFPFPKSLYAVEDVLRLFVADKPNAVVLDFFGGSGTTAHAVARLNHGDGGSRQSITVTNNEVSVTEAAQLKKAGHHPGDPEWEDVGIFQQITRPRLTAAVKGLTPSGSKVMGSYRFRDEFPIADGLTENVEFFELTYLDEAQIEVNQAFAAIAPLLWLRAGGRGPIISECLDAAGRRKPYAWTKRYGVLFNTDRWRSFISKLPETAITVYIVTDSITEFSHIAGELPGHFDVIRLYERYLTTFAVNGR